MITDYTDQDSSLTFMFPESLGVNRFKLVEQRAGHVHFFTFTLLGEQPNSMLNQALQRAISDQNHVGIKAIRSDGRICNENVVVNKSESTQPNVYRLSVIGLSNHPLVLGHPPH